MSDVDTQFCCWLPKSREINKKNLLPIGQIKKSNITFHGSITILYVAYWGWILIFFSGFRQIHSRRGLKIFFPLRSMAKLQWQIRCWTWINTGAKPHLQVIKGVVNLPSYNFTVGTFLFCILKKNCDQFCSPLKIQMHLVKHCAETEHIYWQWNESSTLPSNLKITPFD